MRSPSRSAAVLLTFASTAAVAAVVAARQAQQPPQAPLSSPPIHRILPGQLPVMPPGPGYGDNDGPGVQPAVPLTDVLGTNRALTSFSAIARMHASTSELLGDLGHNTTVLAPLNSAIDALPRKPWEDPRDYQALGASAYEGEGGQDHANENLRRFVEAHLVAVSPWTQGDKVKTVGGREVWWEERDGVRYVMPDRVEVDKVASQVANGEVWILKGVVNYM